MDKKNPLFSKSKLYYAKAENSIRYHRVTNTGGPRQSKRPALHAHLFTKEINVDDLEAIKKKKKKKKKMDMKNSKILVDGTMMVIPVEGRDW